MVQFGKTKHKNMRNVCRKSWEDFGFNRNSKSKRPTCHFGFLGNFLYKSQLHPLHVV